MRIRGGVGSLTDEVPELEKEGKHKGPFLIESDCQERILMFLVHHYFLVGEDMLSSTHGKMFHNGATWEGRSIVQ